MGIGILKWELGRDKFEQRIWSTRPPPGVQVGLLMIGLSESVYWLTWLLTAVAKNCITLALVVLAVKLGNVFEDTSW